MLELRKMVKDGYEGIVAKVNIKLENLTLRTVNNSMKVL